MVSVAFPGLVMLLIRFHSSPRSSARRSPSVMVMNRGRLGLCSWSIRLSMPLYRLTLSLMNFSSSSLTSVGALGRDTNFRGLSSIMCRWVAWVSSALRFL